MYKSLNRYWDPLYGRTSLSEFENKIVFCPDVQRLRYIRLCNINSLLVTGASEVNRFEHTLGVLRLANEWLDSHKTNNEEANDFRAAALFHDVQTGPFGHSFQYILEDNKIEGNFEHENLRKGSESLYYQDITTNASFAGARFLAMKICGERWEKVSAIIKGEGRLGPLIAGSIDLDNIDNVIRLAFHCGIVDRSEGQLAIDLTIGIEPTQHGLIIPDHNIALIEKWQKIRRRLYELLLLDWAEFSAKAMLTRAFEDAIQYNLIGTDSWLMTDDELLHFFQRHSLGDSQSVKQMLHRIRLGNLFAPILLCRSPNVELYKKFSSINTKRKIEKEIRDQVYGKKTGRSILVHSILDYRKTDRAVSVIIKGTDRSFTIGQDSSTLLLGIFVSSPPSSRKDQMNLEKAAMKVLSDFGFKKIEIIPDPMSDIIKEDTQLNLFE